MPDMTINRTTDVASQEQTIHTVRMPNKVPQEERRPLWRLLLALVAVIIGAAIVVDALIDIINTTA